MRISVNVTVPKKLLKDIHVQTALAQKQRKKTVPDVLKLFEGTVNGWQNKPSFGSEQTVSSRQVGVKIHPKGTFGGSNKAYNVYNLVSLGSPAHQIPKRAFTRKWLRFQEGYISSTRPGDLISNRYRRTGAWRMARQVNHPGFAARNFDMYIAEEYKSTFAKDMQDALLDVFAQEWG